MKLKTENKALLYSLSRPNDWMTNRFIVIRGAYRSGLQPDLGQKFEYLRTKHSTGYLHRSPTILIEREVSTDIKLFRRVRA